MQSRRLEVSGRFGVVRASAFVGRVGGLAVALGIGAAVGAGAGGVAWAAPEDSSAAADQDSSAEKSAGDGSASRSPARARVGRSDPGTAGAEADSTAVAPGQRGPRASAVTATADPAPEQFVDRNDSGRGVVDPAVSAELKGSAYPGPRSDAAAVEASETEMVVLTAPPVRPSASVATPSATALPVGAGVIVASPAVLAPTVAAPVAARCRKGCPPC